jgi:hypothetical protein
MNGIDHSFPVSEEISHKLDDVKNNLLSKPAVSEVTRTVTGSKQTMSTLAVALGLVALIFWLKD